MNKVLIISYYWPPKISPGVFRWYYFSKYLPNYGYKPIVFTPLTSKSNNSKNKFDNNIDLIKRKIFDPSDIISKYLNNNINKGILSSSNSILNNFLNWIRINFFIPDSRIFWVNPSVNFLKKYIKDNNIKTIITSGPPHSMHLIGLKIKDILNINWIADFRDPWSSWDILDAMKPRDKIINKHKELEKKILKNADKVIVTNRNLYSEFLNIIDDNKLELLTNGTLLFKNKKKYLSKKFKISYLGLLNKFRFPKVFFNVLKEIIIKNDDIEKDIEIFISGTIDNSIYNYLINDSILKTKINYVKNIEYENTFHHFNSSSLLLLLLNKKSINTTPTKIFDYASSGTPVLTLGEKKDKYMDLLLEELSLEKIVSYSDKTSIENSILKSYKNFKLKIKNKPSENIKKYDRKYLTEKLSKILDYYY